MPHLHFPQHKRDVHLPKDSHRWEYCDRTICPNRYKVKHDKTHDWSKPCEEAEALAYRETEESSEEEEEEEVEEPHTEEPQEDILTQALRLQSKKEEEEGNKEPLATEEITRSLSQQLEKVNLNEEHTPEPIQIPSIAPPTPIKKEKMSLTKTTNEKNTKEETSIKFAPRPYDGNRDLYQAFRDSVELYFLLDDKLESDDKKIAFILSLLSLGEARTWRTNFIRRNRTQGTLTFPLLS